MLPLQAGDLPDTHADTTEFMEQFHYKPATSVEQGVAKFVDWYLNYYKAWITTPINLQSYEANLGVLALPCRQELHHNHLH